MFFLKKNKIKIDHCKSLDYETMMFLKDMLLDALEPF